LSAAPPTVALAIGDLNGIGPEIAVKAAAALAGKTPRVVLVGDAFVLRHYVAQVAPEFTIREVAGGEPPQAQSINIIAVDALSPTAFAPGRVDAAAGRATVAYVEAALRLLRSAHASAVVGCPHNETAINAAGVPFSGYPGLIARLCAVPEDRVFLLLTGGRLRIAHVTLHERLGNALARLSPDLVEAAGRACTAALVSLGIAQPRIGVLAINPHAGEGGLFGDDDARITAPAVERLRAAGFAVEGPAGADVMLSGTELDAYLAMYHDQGHIPVKLLAGRNAAALTIGAGVLFSSVGHGSAFDIAGRSLADPTAVLRALRLVSGLAVDC
jgi:4-hydroxy-L-threonine phosphate dehydrogenase PdxA